MTVRRGRDRRRHHGCRSREHPAPHGVRRRGRPWSRTSTRAGRRPSPTRFPARGRRRRVRADRRRRGRRGRHRLARLDARRAGPGRGRGRQAGAVREAAWRQRWPNAWRWCAAERAAVGAGVPLVSLGFMRRFDPGLRAAEAGARPQGAVGAPLLVHGISRGVSSAPGATNESSVTGSAIHEFDCCPGCWTRRSPRSAGTPPRSPARRDGFRDPQLMLLRTADGVLTTVEVFLNARYGYDVRCEVVGEHGTLALTEPAEDDHRQRAGPDRSATRPTGGRGSPRPTGSNCRPGSTRSRAGTPVAAGHPPTTGWSPMPSRRPSSPPCIDGGHGFVAGRRYPSCV